jgi:tRNA (guanine-N7-)-methyltransferase
MNPNCSLIFRPASFFQPLDLGLVFPHSQPLEVELGAGDGSFLVEYAAARPDRNCLGVERLLGRLRKADRKGLRAGLRNLRLIRVEASYLVAYLLPPSSTRAFHVYFPDPWPKRKHHKHRLVNADFSRAVERALEAEGRIYFRTDDANYFAQICGVFGNAEGFTQVETEPALASVPTDFEREFQKRGIPTLRAAYEKRGSER